MTVLQRIQREPAKLLAFVVAILALLVGRGLISSDDSAWVLAIVAAAIGLLSYFVTPAKEVLEQQLPTGQVIQGRAAVRADHQTDDTGDLNPRVAIAVIVFMAFLVVLTLFVFPPLVEALQ